MSHLVRLLSRFSALAVLCGLVACARPPQPNMPSNAGVAPPTRDPDALGTNATSTQPQTPAAVRPSGAPAYSQSGFSQCPQSAYDQSKLSGYSESWTSKDGVPEPMGAAALDAWPLDDAQIAAVVLAIHQNEIQEGQLAETTAASAQVKWFAQQLVSAHRTMLTHDTAVLLQAQIVPYTNVVSDRINDNATSKSAALRSLQSLHSDEFDRQYIDDQVQAHKKALAFLNHSVNHVQNTDFKAALQSALPQVEAHLRTAERLQQDLRTGATGRTSKQTGKSASSLSAQRLDAELDEGGIRGQQMARGSVHPGGLGR